MPVIMKRLLLLLCLFVAFLPSQSRPKVGLVLGGGGAKGAAQIGALKYIERFDISIDYIAGTSIGSIIGCLYAAGYTADELEQLFCGQPLLNTLTDRREDLRYKPFVRTTNGRDTLNYIFGFPALNFRKGCIGLLNCDNVEHMVDSLLALKGIHNFSDYRRTSFRCVATEFNLFKTIREEVLKEGCVSQAVRASMAFPVIIKHQEIDNQHLVDGGMMNNLPIDVVKSMGAEKVIVIDLQQGEVTIDDEQQRIESLSQLLKFISDWGINFAESTINTVLTLGANAAGALIKEDDFGIIGWALHRPDNRKYIENLHLFQGDDIIHVHPTLPGYDVASFGQQALLRMDSIGKYVARQYRRELAKLMQIANNSMGR